MRLLLLRPSSDSARLDSCGVIGLSSSWSLGAAIIAPAANTECMNLHLQEISTLLIPGSIAVELQLEFELEPLRKVVM